MKDYRIYQVECGRLTKFNAGRKGHKHTSFADCSVHLNNHMMNRIKKRHIFHVRDGNTQYAIMEYTGHYQAEIAGVITFTIKGDDLQMKMM